MENIDYNKKFKELISNIEKDGKKPTLFLHACCGPCLTYPLSILVKYFDVTVGFFNPNIYPVEEYNKRLETMVNFINSYSKKENVSIKIIVNKDDFEKYSSIFKDRINDKEGGQVCLRCHSYRMNLAYKYAYENKYDYFTTVMTVSCKKPSRELNEIAFNLEKQYPTTKYLYSDFKKEDGQLKGIKIAKEYNLYRQNYCGCKPSLLEREAIIESKEENKIIG